MITALILNRDIRGRSFWRAVFFFPVLLSPVVVGLIWRWILQREGLLNLIVDSLGGETVNWLTERTYAFAAAVGVSVWAHMGFYALILLAGLQAIPRDLYEAAEMDGTRPARVFWRITLPLLLPNLLVVIVLALIRAVQIFDEVYVLTGGGPGTSTMFLTQYIYEVGFASLLAQPRPRRRRLDPDGRRPRRPHADAARPRPAQRAPGRAMKRARLPHPPPRRPRAGTGPTSSPSPGSAAGSILIFGPALWLVASSFKTPAQLAEFPPTLLPYVAETATVEGEAKPLYRVTLEDGTTRTLAELRRVGIVARMVDPAAPDEVIEVNIRDRRPVRSLGLALSNYTEPFLHFDFLTYLRNSVFVTVMATLITLLTNSMAAFALSKYDFRGRGAVMLLIIATLMVPLSVILVPLYSVISRDGPLQLALGRDPADRRHADRRLPAAPVHADHPRRAARRRPHGQGVANGRSTGASSCRSPPPPSPSSPSSPWSGAGTTSSGR